MNCSDSQTPRIKSLFYNQHDSTLDRRVNAASRQSLEIQMLFITNLKTYSERHLYEYVKYI